MTAMTAAAGAEALRAAGLRVTAIRQSVLRALDDAPHADVESVRSRVAEDLGSVSVQSVYDTLATLASTGLVRKVEPAGHPARYELYAQDNHHHLACRSCGQLVDVHCTTGSGACLEPADTHGFVLDEAEVTFWGLCPACRG